MSISANGCKAAYLRLAKIVWLLIFCSLLLIQRAECGKPIFFYWPFRSVVTSEFFGKATGSYISEDTLLHDQMEAAIDHDLGSIGTPIQAMPYLGDDQYLDDGSGDGVALPSESGALILTPKGQVIAAALFWQKCWSVDDCYDDRHYLTIFVRDRRHLLRFERIFTNWGKLSLQALSPTFVANNKTFSDTPNWANKPAKLSIPVNVVILGNNK